MFVEALLSSDVDGSLIDNDGVASSSVIVKVPVESLIVAFDALDKVIVTVSFASSNASAKNCYSCFEVSPALNVKFHLLLYNQNLAVAVPFDVA